MTSIARNKSNEQIKSKIKELTKEIRKDINTAKAISKWDKIVKDIQDPRDTKRGWNHIKKILKKKIKNPVKIIGSNNEILKNNLEIANSFSKKLEKTFQPNISNKPILEELSNIWKNTTNHKCKKFKTIDHITLDEVKKKIDNLKNGKSQGIYNTTNKLLKTIINEIRPIPVTLYNYCISLSHFPSYYKIAKIIMIQKKPNTNRLDEFRPISLLPKIFESLICDKINTWLETNNILNQEQSGFRQNRSSHDHIFQLLQSFIFLKNRKRSMSAVFIDFEKAFDTINHTYLLYKLNKLKLPKYLLNIIVSFLTDRSCSVNYNGSNSNSFNIKAGVPQGSCLSPILFCLFVSDIPTNDKCNLSQFADDLAAWARYLKNSHFY